MNFREYILSDIEEKKQFLTTLPQNTKVRRDKYRKTISDMISTYEDHKKMIANFMNYKFDKSLPVSNERNIEDK